MVRCSSCGYVSIKWLGRCPSCGGWETFQEENLPSSRKKISPKEGVIQRIDTISETHTKRILTSIEEFDRVLGGGLVPGEVLLVGGEPGVGKSTLLLEVCTQLAKHGKTLYLSAEESAQQVAIRANRLDAKGESLFIMEEDDLETIAYHIEKEEIMFAVIDSIQVVSHSQCEGIKGSVTQIRGCAHYLTSLAKKLGVVIFMVGHVTKDGIIAGPKLLEHIVDCVLYFEGEKLCQYRILRAMKNRFGATGNIAVFEMTSKGLIQVESIADIFLPHKDMRVSGSCVVSVIEGVRPILIEMQSLVSRATFGVVRRRSIGFDFNRFSLLIAIIEKRLKCNLSNEDIFLNVAGGLKVNDPAADLGVVMAVISSFKDVCLKFPHVFISEVGLAGELRRVSNINIRVKESMRAGFEKCVISQGNIKEIEDDLKPFVLGFETVSEVVEKFIS